MSDNKLIGRPKGSKTKFNLSRRLKQIGIDPVEELLANLNKPNFTRRTKFHTEVWLKIVLALESGRKVSQKSMKAAKNVTPEIVDTWVQPNPNRK